MAQLEGIEGSQRHLHTVTHKQMTSVLIVAFVDRRSRVNAAL